MHVTQRTRLRLRWRRWILWFKRREAYAHARWEYDWVRGARFYIVEGSRPVALEILSQRPYDVKTMGPSVPVPGHPRLRRIVIPESRFHEGIILEIQIDRGVRWRNHYTQAQKSTRRGVTMTWKVFEYFRVY